MSNKSRRQKIKEIVEVAVELKVAYLEVIVPDLGTVKVCPNSLDALPNADSDLAPNLQLDKEVEEPSFEEILFASSG